METLAGSFLFDFSIESDEEGYENYESDFEEGFNLASLVQDIKEENQIETQARVTNPRAKMLEDLETESLMCEWGMNENTFQNSSPHNTFPPTDFSVNETFDLPPLGDGLGPVVQTKNGGFVCSMDPLLFKNSKVGGSLIMQVSSPVVLPAEMGSGIMEILQRLTTSGIEKLSMQTNKIMPLHDITGKTRKRFCGKLNLQLIVATGIICHSLILQLSHESLVQALATQGSEYVSLEDLAPLAMDQIEALSLGGLRI